jgi:uncharacterized protein (TIGR03663 family)
MTGDADPGSGSDPDSTPAAADSAGSRAGDGGDAGPSASEPRTRRADGTPGDAPSVRARLDDVRARLDGAFGTGPTRVTRAVLVVTALALLVRVVGLGARILHWDEGRVGYWILRFHETGELVYRPIVHGPLLFVVNDVLFGLLPPSDFLARLPVAVVGGLFPLLALVVRDRFRGDETVALAVALAASPLLVYYSRFMRNDVLVAAFAAAALAFVVRAVDRGDARALYPAGAALALAFGAKENALLYLACYAGAAVVVLDARLLRRVAAGRPVGSVLRTDWPRTTARRLARFAPDGTPTRPPTRADGGRGAASGSAGPGGSPAAPTGDRVLADGVRAGAVRLGAHLLGALALAVALLTFLYAPRPDLWTALADPARLPGVVDEALLGSARSFAEGWLGTSHQSHDYLPFLYGFLETLAWGAPGVLVCAAVGFVVDSYVAGDRRDVVVFATAWAAASVVGYPVATDIEAPWAVVHAVVPLAVPAAVGLAFLVREARSLLPAREEDGPLADADRRRLAVAGLLLAASAGGVVVANADYLDSTASDDRLVLQYAQAETAMKPAVHDAMTVAAANDGVDVLFVGSRLGDRTYLHVENESSLARPPPGGPAWHTRLPLPWYFERAGARTTSSAPETATAEALADPPPVVVAMSWDAEDVAGELDGYAAHRHRFKLWNEEVVVFVREDAPREPVAGVPVR